MRTDYLTIGGGIRSELLFDFGAGAVCLVLVGVPAFREPLPVDRKSVV